MPSGSDSMVHVKMKKSPPIPVPPAISPQSAFLPRVPSQSEQ
jgi:hypothetical protein